jgi:hypothetical protein
VAVLTDFGPTDPGVGAAADGGVTVAVAVAVAGGRIRRAQGTSSHRKTAAMVAGNGR